MALFKDTDEDEIERLRSVIAKLEKSKGARVVRVEMERKEGYGYVFYITAPTVASEEKFGMAIADAIQSSFKVIGADMRQDVVGGDHIARPKEEVNIPEDKCYLAEGALGRWIIVNAMDRTLAWSGSRWVAHRHGIPNGSVQVSNFESKEAALKSALTANLVVATAGYMVDNESITCFGCGMTSYNGNDIREKYCGNCHRSIAAIATCFMSRIGRRTNQR